ncbi:MAG: AsmA family protein [Pseudomonadota bacterium]
MRWLRRIAIAVGALVVVLIAVGLGLVMLVPKDAVVARVADAVEGATGKRLAVDGAVELSIWPVLGVRAEAVSLSNTLRADEAPLLSAAAFEVGVDPMSLLSDRLDITALRLVEPRVVLVVDIDGTPNWVSPATSAGNEQSGDTALPVITLPDAAIEGGEVLFTDSRSGRRIEVSAIDLTGALQTAPSSFDLALEGSVDHRQRTIALSLSVASDIGPPTGGAIGAALSAEIAELAALSFDGSIFTGEASRVEGQFTGQTGSLPALAAWLVEGTDLPPEMPEALSLSGRLAAENGRLGIDGMALTLGESSLAGAVAVETEGARPKLIVDLDADLLDLSPFMADDAAAPTPPARDGIDASALRAVDADIALRARSIDLGDLAVGQTQLAAVLAGGRLDLTIGEAEVTGGSVAGTITLADADGIAVTTDLTARGVRLQPLLIGIANTDAMTGRGDIDLQLSGRGRTTDALLASLGGTGSVVLRDGALIGYSLPAMVRNIAGQTGGGARTAFDETGASFSARNGVLTSSDIRFLGPAIRVTGRGSVDLARRRLNLRLTPEAVAALPGPLGGTGVPVFPLIVTGPWASPRVEPDLGAAIGGIIAAPGQALETLTGAVGITPSKPARALQNTIRGLFGD